MFDEHTDKSIKRNKCSAKNPFLYKRFLSNSGNICKEFSLVQIKANG